MVEVYLSRLRASPQDLICNARISASTGVRRATCSGSVSLESISLLREADDVASRPHALH